MRRSIRQLVLFTTFLVATAHAQWTPTNATTNDPISHANDITVTGNVAVDNATLRPWTSGKVVQGTSSTFFLGRGGDIHIISNAYLSAGGWNYMTSGNAANLYLYNGDLILRTAPSGTADTALTWTAYPLQIKSSGNVLVGMATGATSNYTLDVNGPQHIAGNVAIGGGTSLPPQKLTVFGGHIALDNGWQLIGRDASNSFHFRLIGNDSANRILLGDNTTSVANEVRFHTNGGTTPTMVVNTAGNVGIGTTAPPHRLTVAGGHIALDNGLQLLGRDASNSFHSRLIGNDSANRILLGDNTTSVANEVRFHTNGSPTPTMVVNTLGNVGIGTTVPGEALQVNGAVKVTGTTGTVLANSSSLDYLSTGARIVSFGPSTSAPATWSLILKSSDASLGGARMTVDSAGNVGIGMIVPLYLLDVAGTGHFSGNVTVDGNINAKYQDVAEWVSADEAMAAGTVVVVGEDANNTVTASMHAYDTSVAGVVSANPGLLLGVASATKAKIATTGRVRVRVDATKSPIRKGDLLVTSDRPGMAMKSEPLDLGGVKLHRPGTLIGKALEPLAGGEGEILVLLSLQ
jgi:nitrogen fixation protein